MDEKNKRYISLISKTETGCIAELTCGHKFSVPRELEDKLTMTTIVYCPVCELEPSDKQTVQ